MNSNLFSNFVWMEIRLLLGTCLTHDSTAFSCGRLELQMQFEEIVWSDGSTEIAQRRRVTTDLENSIFSAT